MQFNIRTLLAIMVVVSVFCGIVFAAPPVVATPILICILWISPSLWINGVIYGRGAWRPFFIGGIMAGLGPHLFALYYTGMVAAQLLENNGWAELLAGDRMTNLMIAAIFLFPGVFSLLGGLTGVWTWWMFQPARSTLKSDDLANGVPTAEDYVIVSGRLTAERAVHGS